MKLRLTSIMAAVTMIGMGVSGVAKAEGDFSYRLSGFGTLGVVQTDTDLADFASFSQNRGASKSASLDPDSKIGVQLDASFNKNISAVVQLQTISATKSGAWRPDVDWAFVKANLGEYFDARVGRIGIPFFMVSDFRNVDYANVWLRAPLEVYGQVPIRSFDGVDVHFQKEIADTVLNAQIYGGTSKSVLRGADVKLNNLVGVTSSAQFGFLTLRAGYAKAKVSVTWDRSDALVSALREIGSLPVPQFSEMGAAGDNFEINGRDITFSGVGATLEGNNVIVNAEYTRRKVNGGFTPSTVGWYSTAGYRFGKWTPYVTIAKLKQTSPTSSSAVPSIAALGPLASQLPPEVVGALPVLDAELNSALASVGQKSTGIGFRWDFQRNFALKAQYDRIKVEAYQPYIGLFNNLQPGFGVKPINVYSIALNFVF